jgi:protein-L-isoaspartate(D-aspartate) O-methyltransferase
MVVEQLKHVAVDSPNTGLASERVRARMVERVRGYGVKDARVLGAIDAIPRHCFVDAALASRAYEDTALPIGHGQTISRPYTVARIAELALERIEHPKAAKVLEIGTGCGYASAVLSVLFGDGYNGLAGEAPFDAIVAAAAGEEIPRAWIEQLKPGGRIVAPVISDVQSNEQTLKVIAKDLLGRVTQRSMQAARFVPLRAGTK